MHLITRSKDSDALSDIDASQFKEALMLLMVSLTYSSVLAFSWIVCEQLPFKHVENFSNFSAVLLFRCNSVLLLFR